MQNFSFLGDVQVVFQWLKKKIKESVVLMAILATAQTVLNYYSSPKSSVCQISLVDPPGMENMRDSIFHPAND